MNEMKLGRALCMDDFLVECAKKCMTMSEILVRLLNVSFDMGAVHMNWPGACIVPLYEGKGDKYECSNSRGIS